MRKILFIIPFFLWSCGDSESSPTEPSSMPQHGKMYGGTGREMGKDIQATSDGGFILAGYTDSFGAGDYDMYLVKTDASGNEMWSQTFGGSDYELAYSIEETSDGGFILAGHTDSFGAGDYDMYLVKTDASGNEMWSQTFGGTGREIGKDIQATSDGGFILAGYTDSFGAGGHDVYVVKTDASGNEIWSQTFGGSGNDIAYSIKETSDGGFILGCSGMYLVKTDASGSEMWSQTFEGQVSGGDVAFYDLLEISDGGYIMAGYTQTDSFGHDMYVIKTDASGSEMWRKTHGEESWLLSQNIQLWDPSFPSSTTSEIAYSIDETSDGGFILGGETSLVSRNMYLIKIDSAGNRIF